MCVDKVVGLVLSLTYAVSRPSNLLKPRYMHNPSAQMPGRGTQHTAVEEMPVYFLQQDGPHQVLGWRYRDMLLGRALYDTYEETYFNMTTFDWVEVAELQSTQEEADTRFLCMRQELVRRQS